MIDVVKRGLKFLKKRVASYKTQLETDLKAEIISVEDVTRVSICQWLDVEQQLPTNEEIFTHRPV